MRSLEEIGKKLNFITKSKNYKKAFYDKFIRYNKININKYPELVLYYPSLENEINWTYISKFCRLSENFIKKFKDKIDWEFICVYQQLSENVIKEFKDYVNWRYISRHQKLSEKFIKEFKDKVDWECISKYQQLSEDFIRTFKGNVDWQYISVYQKLSEDFIRTFKDYVDWQYISMCQQLSENFIKEFKDYVNWSNIARYQYLSDSFVKEFNLTINDYKVNEEELLNFEIIDGYVYGYKAVRQDRYSKFNFQYQYLDGTIHESFSDKSSDENSFGLNIGTLSYAKDYMSVNDIILKVRTKIEDITRVVHCKEKIRTKKLEILHQI